MDCNVRLYRSNKASILFYSCIFIGLFYFFTNIHPLYIFDTDDWGNMAFGRRLYPSLKQYNPIKVFPETAMPFVSTVCLKIFYPLTNDYVGSLSIGYSFLYSSVIVVFLLALEKTIKFIKEQLKQQKKIHEKILPQEQFENYFYVFWVFVLMFSLGANSSYLFREVNVTCIFHYSIPALLNISLVLFLISGRSEKQLLIFDNYILNGFFILLLYIAIFSNLFQSVVLSSYIATTIILNVINFIYKKIYVTRKNSLLIFFLNNYQYIVYLFIWVGSCLYEANGNRAADIGNTSLTYNEIVNSIKVFLFQVLPFSNISKLTLFFCFIVLSIVICLYRFLKKRLNNLDKNFLTIQMKFSFIFFGVVSFYILSTIKTGLGYQFRESLIACWSIWIILLCLSAFIYLSCYCNFIKLIMPIYLCAILMLLCTRLPVFDEINFLPHQDAKNIKEFSNYVVNQFIQADKNNENNLSLHVPKFKTKDNWPFATYANFAISLSLQGQGITKKFINVTIIPDKKINDKFNILSE